MKRRANKHSEKTLDVTIERIVPDGYGIGFADGLTVFVPLAVSGDKLRVKIERQKGKVAFGSIGAILEVAPQRIAPPCPYFGSCGGCDFQQMTYRAQLQAKVGIVRDALRRIGKIDWQQEIKIIASPHEWNYRTRVQWKYEGRRFGYYQRQSHRIENVEICPILSPALQTELERQREAVTAQRLTSGNQVQAVSSADQISVRFADNHGNFDETFYAANKQAEDGESSFVQSKEADIAAIDLTVNDFNYRFNANCFFQVNHEILPFVLDSVLAEAAGDVALDLYCGVGLFTLPLGRKFNRVVGVEGNPESVRFAKLNAENANLNNLQFETAFVGAWLRQNISRLVAVDFVVLDPPRTGAERETMEHLIALQPQQIVYVSCNPTTLARDLQLLLASGIFTVENVTAFDFFPQTHHVETVVRLRKFVGNTKSCDSPLNSAN